MKKIFTIILAVLLINTISKAQDTLYMYKNGSVVGKRAILEIDSITFYKTPDAPANTASDIDGNIYSFVTIGTQTWMAENLKTTKYRNGDLIGTTTASIPNDASSKYQWAYNNDENNVATYGRLYTWYAATDAREICPIGWHLPSDDEWTTLTNYLGNYAGNKLKETGTTHWSQTTGAVTNETGFTALPSGSRYGVGTFINIGNNGSWWSSTEGSTTNAWTRVMYDDDYFVDRNSTNKSYGESVRCLRD